MITKEQLLALLEGNTEIISGQLSEKAEFVTTDIVEQLGEAMLNEMTPGHKEMVKQHIDNVGVNDYDADGSGKAKAKTTKDGRIKNPKRPDERDEFNELGDFKANGGKTPKLDSKPNSGADVYTTERKKQRKIDEAVGTLIESWFKRRSQPVETMGKDEPKKPDWKLKYKQPGESEEAYKKRMTATVKEEIESIDEARKISGTYHAVDGDKVTKTGTYHQIRKHVDKHGGALVHTLVLNKVLGTKATPIQQKIMADYKNAISK